ncbi:MAG: outer membrane beta-barrel protein [Bacteroidetes bacterium]|nr:outer membrane beta-barrel protein [Bacteroidota bacterium]
MNLEEEFDGIIRQKAGEMKFPFDEKNWEKAAAMLDAERKAAGGGGFRAGYIVSAMVVVFVASAVVGVSLVNNSTNQEKITAQKEFKPQTTSIISQNNKVAETKPQQVNETKQPEIPVNRNNILKTSSNENNTVLKEESSVSENTNQVFENNDLAQENDIYLLSPVTAELPENIETQEINNLPFTVLKNYDDDYYHKNAKRKTHYLNVELGGIYVLGWQTQEGKDGHGADWFGGFNYGVYLSKKINVSAGLQTYNIRNINQAFYTNQKTEYDFGVVTSNTVITSNHLYYMAVPLKLNYALNSANHLALGVNAGYVVAAKNTVQTYQEKEGNAKSNFTTVKNTALYDGVNSLNLMLTASYKTEIAPRLFLNGELVYGVTDIFKNNKNVKNQENLMGVRIGLQYHLFDK